METQSSTTGTGPDALHQELEDLKRSQAETAKLLIRRDLALTRANEQLRALDSAKSDFISVAAHQLRTPLSAVKWIINMLEKDEFVSPEERTDFIEKAAVSVDRIIQLVNDLLEVDHIESGKTKFVFTTVDVGSVIQLVVSDLQNQADKRQVRLVTDLLPGTWVRGDVEKLHAVFQNLVENAVKYTQENGTVTVTVRRTDGTVEITVMDTGIGIPKNQIPRLFTKFFRAENAMRLDTTGSGLGLFIAKQIVERHGGTIRVASEEGKGTTFTLSFPYFTGGESVQDN